MTLRLACLGLLLLASPVLADTAAGVAAITPDAAERSVRHLASDALEGRGSGAAGGEAAGEWLAAQLTAIGVAPAGEGGTFFQSFSDANEDMRNVLGTIEGREPGEAVVIGAHYDHLGLGHQEGSLDLFNGKGQIHNGADDNASGTAAVLEIARAFVASGVQPRRRVVFAFFDGEERGLLGSHYWVKHPTLVNLRVTLMINLDMVGRLRDKVTVYGASTGDLLPDWLARANEGLGLELDLRRSITGNSDHYPFYQAGIPVLMPFTGLHTDYHRPSDDIERVNFEGVAKIARLSYGVAAIAADAEQPAAYAKAPDGTGEAMLEQLQAMLGTEGFGEKLQDLRERLGLGKGEGNALEGLAERLQGLFGGDRGDRGRGAQRPRLGVTLEGEAEGPGALVRSVTPGSLAEGAGLRAGDRIVGFSGAAVKDVEDLRARVAAAKGRVELELVRGDGGARETVSVDFGGDAAPARPERPRRQPQPTPAPDGPRGDDEGRRWF
jgi:hypothetical protein